AALLIGMSLQYYKVVQKQAQQSFFSALGAAVLGTGFFIYACWLAMHATAADATVSLIAGGLIQVISGINFHLYSKTTRQFAGFQMCLERMDRFLLANSYCENLSSDSVKDDCRRKTIEVMVTAPMLTLEQVGISVPRPAPAVPKREHAAGTAGD